MECVAGCKVFAGNEIYHHKDCPFYPKSFSKRFDKLQVENARLKPYEQAIREAHNGYQDNEFPEPSSPKQAIKDLNDSWERMENNYVDQIVQLQSENVRLKEKIRWIPVSERLPEPITKQIHHSQNVLIVQDKQDVCKGYYQENHQQWIIYGNYQNPREYQRKITHWKPIILPDIANANK